ncbi:MAG: DinB family protein [Balneolaceae bacterium]
MMKKINYSVLTFAVLAFALVAVGMDKSTDQQEKSYEYLDRELTNAKEFTLEVFEGMPEEDYSFKPGEEMRTFGEQAFHIAYTFEWFNARLSGAPIAWEPGDESRMSKDELITYATDQMDKFIEMVQSSEESGQLTAAILGTLRHNSHHRGQMIAYYRANGMTPPSYR